MGACGGKEKPNDNKNLQDQAQAALQLVAEPKLPAEAQTVEAKHRYLSSPIITQYLMSKHVGYVELFAGLEKQIYMKKEEVQQYLKLIHGDFGFKDHYFDHIKELHKQVTSLIDNELQVFQSHQIVWTNEDFELMQHAIMFLFQVGHIVNTIQGKDYKSTQNWWQEPYFKKYLDYFVQHFKKQHVHNPIWHSDLTDTLQIEQHFRESLIERNKQLQELQVKLEEQKKIENLKKLREIHDEVMSKITEEEQLNKDVQFVRNKTHQYALPTSTLKHN